MADDPTSIREVVQSMEFMNASLGKSISNLDSNIGIRIDGISSNIHDSLDFMNRRLNLMTGVFVLFVGLNCSAFWYLSSRIDHFSDLISSNTNVSKNQTEKLTDIASEFSKSNRDLSIQIIEMNKRLSDILTVLQTKNAPISDKNNDINFINAVSDEDWKNTLGYLKLDMDSFIIVRYEGPNGKIDLNKSSAENLSDIKNNIKIAESSPFHLVDIDTIPPNLLDRMRAVLAGR